MSDTLERTIQLLGQRLAQEIVNNAYAQASLEAAQEREKALEQRVKDLDQPEVTGA